MKARYEFQSESEWHEYIRFYFAGLAMQGICANLEHIYDTYENTPEHELIVKKSIRIADELLKQLEK